MTNPRRIGFVVHAGKNSIGDRDALLRWIAEFRPVWMGTLDDYDLALARDMITASPKTKVLTRFIDGGEKTHYRRSGFITEVIPAWVTLNGATHPNVYFNVLCEPTLESELDVRQMVAWMTTFMAEMARHNMKLAGPHLGVATWHPHQIDGGWYDDLLYAMHTYPQHIFTVDEYGGPSLPNSINHPAEWQTQKDKVQPGMWPSKDSLPIARQPDGSMPPYYLILRVAQFIIRNRQLGLGDGRWLIAEWGNDRIDELQNKAQVYSTLEQRYSWPKPYLNIRGAATLQYVYDNWREGVSLEDAIADADLHTEALYPDCVEGMLRYFWCYNHPDDYSYGFNIAPWRVYQRRLIQAAQTEAPAPPPVPTPTPTPAPFLDNWPLVGLLLGIILILLLYIFKRPVSAQEVSMVMPVDQAGQILLTALFGILVGALQTPVAEPLINVVKFISQLLTNRFGLPLLSGDSANLLVAAVITIAVWLSRWLGADVQLQTVFDWIVSLAPVVLTILTTLFGAQWLHTQAAKRDTALFGYQRTPDNGRVAKAS